MNKSRQSFFCPLCEREIDGFLPRGNPPRPNRRCPVCKSNVRVRFAWLVLQQKTNLFDDSRKRLLHFAPHQALVKKLAGLDQIDYLSADLEPGKAMIETDMTNIQFPDGSFDAVVCSHVLEHIAEDRKAMGELFRILKPGGWALVIVPVEGETTLEDPGITDPQERERVFRQRDHVRIYGRDVKGRLEGAGFVVSVIRPGDVIRDGDFKRYGIPDESDRMIHLCQKRA